MLGRRASSVGLKYTALNVLETAISGEGDDLDLAEDVELYNYTNGPHDLFALFI